MTRFLIDTHVLLWWASDPHVLTDEARIVIAGGRNQLLFSHASFWEIAIKISNGKLRLPEPTTELIQRARCRALPITAEHIDSIVHLPHLHRDPFDRMLIAQAKVEDLVLVTRDEDILKYDIPTLAA